MPVPTSLPISRLINVSVSLAPTAAQGQNLNTLLILGSSTIIDVVSRMRSYFTLAAVATDFGTSAPEYLAASLWFGQTPQPVSLLIGRWAQNASHGQLFGGALTAAQQAMGNWTTITNGGFTITIDGGSAQHLTGLNFSAAANLNAVAADIGASLTGATIVWNANLNRFEITSNSTGATSSVSFATSPGSGTDISAQLGLTSTFSGAYQANGIVAESALTAVTLFDNNFGQSWYGLMIPQAADSDHQAIAPFIEGSSNYHLYGLTTQEAGVLSASSTTDIAFLLSASAFTKTCFQYSSTSAYAVASLLAKALTIDYSGANTTIITMYKQEPGVTPENLTASQEAALLAKNCNAFVANNNGTAIIEKGTVASGVFIDIITGIAAFAVTLQTAGFNLLFTNPKIPQTDGGIHQIVATAESICDQFVTNGFIGGGLTWNSAPFGIIQTGQVLPKGYSVYAPPISTQTQAARASRVSPSIQIGIKTAGGVQDILFNTVVNQ